MGIQGRNHIGIVLAGWLFGLFLASFLTHPRPACLGVVRHLIGRALRHQCAVKTIPYGEACRLTDLGNSVIKTFFPNDHRLC